MKTPDIQSTVGLGESAFVAKAMKNYGVSMTAEQFRKHMTQIQEIIANIKTDPKKLEQAKQGGFLDRRFW